MSFLVRLSLSSEDVSGGTSSRVANGVLPTPAPPSGAFARSLFASFPGSHQGRKIWGCEDGQPRLAHVCGRSGVGKPGGVTGRSDSASLSFERDVRPMFREKDHDSMAGHIDLWSYSDVRAHQYAILERLSEGTMPCDGAWPQERVAVFQRWIAGGSEP
jgi:hypothetical protein